MNSQESKTIRELREIAKRRNMVGYYKLRKADLIAAISKHGLSVRPMDLLDTPFPKMTNTQFLLRINTFHQQNNRV